MSRGMSEGTSEAVIQVRDVSFSYGGPPILEHVTLDVERGEFLGLVGPNGGGKSTLLKVMLGLLRPSRGTVRVLGRPVEAGRRAIGYVPQYAEFPRDFPIRVEDTVLMGRLGQTRSLFGYTHGDRAAARRALQRAEAGELAGRRIDALSGGQLQRVMIARALAVEPEVLMLDEPTANIDMRVETDIFDLLKQLQSQVTILVVSHDIGFISQYVDRVACLNRTLLCHRTDAIDGKTIEELYGAPVRMIHHVH
jgi:zinc transport system ATP-binding protein